jgi:hypothetical protein
VQLFASVVTGEIKTDQLGALHSHITMEIIGNSMFAPMIDNLTHIE